MTKRTVQEIVAYILQQKLDYLNPDPAKITLVYPSKRKQTQGATEDLPILEVEAFSANSVTLQVKEGRALASEFNASVQMTLPTGKMLFMTAGMPTAHVINQLRNDAL